MIQNIATQAVYVSGQGEAEKFWTKNVGFEVFARHDMGNGSFWLWTKRRSIKNCPLPRSIMKDWQERRPSIVFQCDDVESTYLQLKERNMEVGVSTFSDEVGKIQYLQRPRRK